MLEQVTAIERAANGWQQHEYRAGEHVRLKEPELTLPVSEIYEGIELEAS